MVNKNNKNINITEYLNELYPSTPNLKRERLGQYLDEGLIISENQFLFGTRNIYPESGDKRIELAKKGDGFLGYAFHYKLKLASFPELK